MKIKLIHTNDNHGNAEVHLADCGHIFRLIRNGGQFTFDAETAIEAVKRVWGEEMIEEDVFNTGQTEEEVLNSYLHNTKFAPCVKFTAAGRIVAPAPRG